MGEEVDLFDCKGVASPQIIKLLEELTDPPQDPELLAKLIDGYAGIDLALGLAGFEADRHWVRNETFKVIRRIRSDAGHLMLLQDKHRDVDLLEISLMDLISSENQNTLKSGKVNDILSALSALAEVDLPVNKASFGGKAVNDQTIERVVLAVAVYCAQVGIKFNGIPRRTQTATGPSYPRHSHAAVLTASVLDALKLPFNDKALGTYMEKAREATAGLPS